jgi:hypothetical protein
MRTYLRWFVGLLAFLHGFIHSIGAVKGFGWNEVEQLQEPIGVGLGIAWLAATVLMIAAGALLWASHRLWWLVGAVAVVVSQAVIFTSWADAKAGTVANAIVFVAVIYGVASRGPRSFSRQYRQQVERTLISASANRERVGEVVTEVDLATLPEPVATYLRRCGAFGQPRVWNFRAKLHGRIRAGVEKPWMTFTGEQVNTYGSHPSRLFLLDATMFGLPVDVFHEFVDTGASMRVRICSLLPMANASGPELTRAETVTLFNDLCILAPAALVDAPIVWLHSDRFHAVGSFTNGVHTVTADLRFNEDGDLVDFVSDDRLRASANGERFVFQRWSTPVREYRNVGVRRLSTIGEARWHAPEPEGTFTYIDVVVDAIDYNIVDATTRDVGDVRQRGDQRVRDAASREARSTR